MAVRRLFALIVATLVLILPSVVEPIVHAQGADTYYVRNGGGTTTQCTGLANADYDGSGTGEACAYASPQDAIDAATWGDFIKFHAGETFVISPGYAFGGLVLPDKGTPPTNTDADYITLTTDDPSGTPPALSGYPANHTRITTAMAANMPHLQGDGSTPAISFASNSEYWKIERLDIHNGTQSWQTIVLISHGDATNLRNITIQYNWIHPIEEVGQTFDTTSPNDRRSAENAIYLNAENATVQYNAIQGFVGRVKHGGDVGARMTSAGWLMGGNYLTMQYNLIEAWTYAFFMGGSGAPTPTNYGTIVSCSDALNCTLSNTTGLEVGDAISIHNSSVTRMYHRTGIGDQCLYDTYDTATSAAKWGSTYVSAVDHDTNAVTFQSYLCRSCDGNNSCHWLPSASDPDNAANQPVPQAGDTAQWDGTQSANNVLVYRNIFAHYPEWTEEMEDCGGKGYGEIKSCNNCLFDGNIFTGCTAITITARNQTADFAWVGINNTTFSNNYFKNSNNPFVAYLRDSTPNNKSVNYTWTNNLIVGLHANTLYYPGGVVSGNFGGVNGATFTHNTIAWSKTNTPGMTVNHYQNWNNFYGAQYAFSPAGVGADYHTTVENLVIRDNILPVARNICYDLDGNSTSLNDCWPSATVSNNVLVNTDSYTGTEVSDWWTTLYPSNYVVSSVGAIGYTSPNANLDADGDYQLLSSSDYYQAASDDKDIGVDFPQLIEHLGFDPFDTEGAAPPSVRFHGARLLIQCIAIISLFGLVGWLHTVWRTRVRESVAAIQPVGPYRTVIGRRGRRQLEAHESVPVSKFRLRELLRRKKNES